MWTQITVDEEAGLVYLPVEDPTSDLYGGHRPGNNLFGDSIVCVDLKTGQRKWHFQIVHHPIWDLDMPAAPLLADINVNGKPIKAVAQCRPSRASSSCSIASPASRCGRLRSARCRRPTSRARRPAPTQPFPTKPPAYSRNGVVESDLIDFTPELKAAGLEAAKRYRLGPVYLPPLVSKAEGPVAALTSGTLSGGVNWPGSAYDPELHTFFSHVCNACIAPLGLVAPPKEFSDLDYVMGTAGQTFRAIVGGGEGEAADAPRPARPAAPPTPPPPPTTRADDGRRAPERRVAGRGGRGGGGGGGGFGATVQGLSIVKPPYGMIVAINLDKGDLMWSTPHGDTPDGVRNHPALRGVNDPEDRTERQRRRGGHQDARHRGRPAGHDDAGASARGDAARVRQDHRQGSRRGVDAGAAERLADDLHGRRPAVHRRRRERRQLFGRVHRVQPAGVGAAVGDRTVRPRFSLSPQAGELTSPA